MFDRVRAWAQRNLPRREDLARSRWAGPFRRHLLRSELWRFTRRSVPRGAAIGLLVGIFLLIPGIQIVGAALMSLPFRANVPVAAAMTFLSNPATTPLILISSIYVGNRFLGYHADMATLAILRDEGASIADYARWAVSDAAPAILTGLGLISIVSAAVGYVVAAFLWRMWIARKWRQRQLQRALRGA